MKHDEFKVYNEKQKLLFLKEVYFNNENTQNTYYNYFIAVKKIEEQYNQDLATFNLEQIDEMVKGLNFSSVQAIESALSCYIAYTDFCIDRGLVESDGYNNLKIYSDTASLEEHLNSIKIKNKYITKDDLQTITSSIVNPMDKVIFQGIYEGVGGTDMAYLRNLKMSDIDLEKQQVHLTKKDGTPFKKDVSVEFIKYCKQANAIKEYFPNNGESTKFISQELVDNDYIIRPAKNYSTETNESNAVPKATILQKFNKLRDALGYPYLSPTSLRDSGIFHKSEQYAKEDGRDEVNKDDFIKLKSDNEYQLTDIQVYNLMRKYNVQKQL